MASAHVVSSEVPEIQPPALLPSSPFPKSASADTDLPANGQIQVSIKHSICARNINV